MATQTYSGPILLAKLAVTTGLVKWRPCDCSPAKITVERAIALVKAGNYTGGGSESRVRYIREVPPAHPRGVRVECYRNTEAAVLPPSPEWLREHGGQKSRLVHAGCTLEGQQG